MVNLEKALKHTHTHKHKGSLRNSIQRQSLMFEDLFRRINIIHIQVYKQITYTSKYICTNENSGNSLNLIN